MCVWVDLKKMFSFWGSWKASKCSSIHKLALKNISLIVRGIKYIVQILWRNTYLPSVCHTGTCLASLNIRSVIQVLKFKQTFIQICEKYEFSKYFSLDPSWTYRTWIEGKKRNVIDSISCKRNSPVSMTS